MVVVKYSHYEKENAYDIAPLRCFGNEAAAQRTIRSASMHHLHETCSNWHSSASGICTVIRCVRAGALNAVR